MRDEKVLLISDTSRWSRFCHEYLSKSFRELEWFAWDYGEPKKKSFADWNGCDILLSFKSDYIVSNSMLKKVRDVALNFHPSIPDYRGIGGYQLALDERRAEFGCTCHHITPEIDAGAIVDVRRFNINPHKESTQGLSERTASVALEQFYWAVESLVEIGYENLPLANEKWGDQLYTRAMLRNRNKPE